MIFGRSFEIEITTPENEQIIIRPPFSVQFSISKNTLSSPNTCNLIITNLSRATRQRIYKDRYTLGEYWAMIIRGGYKNLQTIFKGNIFEAFSVKSGTEWVTQIQGYDGMYGIQNGYTSRTVTAGTDKQNVIQNAIADMPKTLTGFLGGPSQGTSDRGRVLMGQSTKIISEETDGQYFLDNETLNVISDKEVIINRIYRLTSDQLLITPMRRETFVQVDMMFQPEIRVGNLAELESKERVYNGEYKILGLTHNVTISGATCGEAKTTINLFAGAGILQGVS